MTNWGQICQMLKLWHTPPSARRRLRALLPGALLASVLLGGTAAASPFFLAAPLSTNGTTFRSFGVVATVVASCS